jgi:copper(I)-binding protein
MTDSFDISRNVSESFTISLPEYTENTTLIARLTGTISIVASSVSTIKELVPLAITAPVITATPTSTAMGATTATISTTAADCYIIVGVTSTFSSTDTILGMGTLPL